MYLTEVSDTCICPIAHTAGMTRAKPHIGTFSLRRSQPVYTSERVQDYYVNRSVWLALWNVDVSMVGYIVIHVLCMYCRVRGSYDHITCNAMNSYCQLSV